MKRTSFVCFGAQGHKDSLVYQEIPGRDGGEEFFLFFSPGDPAQEPLLRNLFREAVSTSRLGAPEHYFSRFIEQFKARGGSGDGELIAGALILIQIRRGNEVHLLFNRDASLVHWAGGAEWGSAAGSLRGYEEIPMTSGREQGDLFRRAPEDLFTVARFSLADGDHTLVLAPSGDFIDRHAESFRNSVFFPSFEFPRETGIELAVPRSFPALRWKGGREPEAAPAAPRPAVERRTRRTPLLAGAVLAGIALLAFLLPLARHKGPPSSKNGAPLLTAADAARESSAAKTEGAEARDRGDAAKGASGRETLSLGEAWKRSFRKAVTSSPQLHEGRLYVGCRDGFLYAFDPRGIPLWKYRSRAGIGASPCCLPGKVIGANYQGDVFCLDAGAGKMVWSFPTRSKIVATPAAGGNILVVGTTGGKLVAVRLRDARKLWEKKLGTSIRANPVVGTDYVLAATTDGTLYRLDLRGAVVWKASCGGIPASPVCKADRDLVVFGTTAGDLVGVALSSGKTVWRLAAGSAVDGAPTGGRDAIFVGTKAGDLLAVSYDGAVVWRAQVGGAVHSKPAIEGTILLVTTYASKLVAVDMESGRVVGEYLAGSPIYSSPESDGARVYFGSNGGALYAIWLKPPVSS